MLRWAFVALGVVALLGFLLTGALQTAAEARYPKVQWVVGNTPVGNVERARIDGLPRLKGQGPEESVFIDRRYRNRSQPFGIEARIFTLARLGCIGALLTSIAGFLTYRRFERSLRIERGETAL